MSHLGSSSQVLRMFPRIRQEETHFSVGTLFSIDDNYFVQRFSISRLAKTLKFLYLEVAVYLHGRMMRRVAWPTYSSPGRERPSSGISTQQGTASSGTSARHHNGVP